MARLGLAVAPLLFVREFGVAQVAQLALAVVLLLRLQILLLALGSPGLFKTIFGSLRLFEILKYLILGSLVVGGALFIINFGALEI